MRAKAFLQSVLHQRRMAEVYRREADEAEKDIAFIHCGGYGGTHGGGSADLSGKVARIERYTRRAVAAKEKLQDMRARAERLIDAIERPEYREILHRRYLLAERWESIADEMSYSLHHIYKMHGAALIEADKKMIPNDTF